MDLAVAEWRERVGRYLDRELWEPAPASSASVAWGRKSLQVLVIVVQGIERDQLLLRASALTYFSMLSLIPLIAVALLLVGAFADTAQVQAFIVKQISEAVPEAERHVKNVLSSINLTGLGIVGATTLLLTTVLGLSNVERSFNAIWGVERQRSWARRFPDYLAVLVVAPLMLSLALSMRTTFQSQTALQWLFELPGFEQAYDFGLKQLPTLLLCVSFSFLYWFLPNTRVRPVPALLGGLVGAVLFGVAQTAFLRFGVGSAKASAFFGSFAALPLLLLWMYLSWAIVLLGAEFAFAAQNLRSFRIARQGEDPRPAAREALGLAVAARVARAFRDGEGGVTAEELAHELDAPVRSIRSILGELESAGVVAPRGDVERDGFQLGRAAEQIPVGDVFEALRGPEKVSIADNEVGPSVEALLRDLDSGCAEALSKRTLADLAGPPRVAPRRAAG